MESGLGLQGTLALALGHDALSQALLESAQCLALLAACQGPHPTAGSLSLLGAACMAAGEAQRALHFLERAQQAEQLQWGPCGAAGAAPGLPQAAAAAVAPTAGLAAVAGVAPPSAFTLLPSIADCHERLGQWGEALAALERIPPAQRCARTWARLGRLHSRTASGCLPAMAAYRACLRLCPWAIEAALALAKLRAPAEEVCALMSGLASPTALRRLLQQSPQLRDLAAAQPAWDAPAAVGAAAAAGPGSGTSWSSWEDASLDSDPEAHPLAGGAASGPGGACSAAAPGSTADPEPPRTLPAALWQRPSLGVAALEAEQGGWRRPVVTQLDSLLRIESAHERQPGSREPAPADGEALAAGAATEAEEDGASGVHTPPASSPVAAARSSPFACSPWQGTPAAAPAQQPCAAACQTGSPPSSCADGSLAAQQQRQQSQSHQQAPRRVPHPRCQLAPAAPAQQRQQPVLAGCAAAARQQAASARTQVSHQQVEAHSQQPGECEPQHEPRVPQAVLAAAQRTLRCLRLLVRLTAALAAEDKAAALPLARQLLDAAPGHPMALVLAAQCQADHGSADSARSLYALAREADPFSLAGAARHADLLRQAGDSVALADLACQLSADAGLAGVPGRAEPWLVAAHAKELAGDLYEALGLLRKALERDPGCAEARLQMGRLVLRARGATGAAGLADLHAALRLRPSVRAFREAAMAALDADEVQGARRLARQAREAFPASPACWLVQAQVLARDLRGAGQAEALVRRVLQEEPRCEEAALTLAVLLAQQGRQGEADALLADQLAAAPSLAVHVLAGRMALESGRLEDAASHFNAALGHNPFSHAAAQGLQELEALLGTTKADSDADGAGEYEHAPNRGTHGDDPFDSYDMLT